MERGLSTEGLKADLVNCLQDRLDEEEFGDPTLGTPSALKTGSSDVEPSVADKTPPEAPTPGTEKVKVEEPLKTNSIEPKDQVDDKSVNEKKTDEDESKDTEETKAG